LIISGSNNFDTTGTNFTYDSTLSPTVTSLSPSSGSGTTLTITGTGFGSDSSIIIFL